MSNEFALTIPTAITSTIVTILTVAIAIFMLVINTKSDCDNTLKTESSTSDNKSYHNSRVADSEIAIKKYFEYSSSSSVIFNALCSLSNAVYCIYLVFDPFYDDNPDILYFQHSSFFLRIVSTFCWLGGAISLLWFFNGRLFFAFKGSVYAPSKILFISINIFATATGIILFTAAFYGVYWQNLLIQEISFTSFRIFYQIITFSLLYMFSRRLLFLTIQKQSMPIFNNNNNNNNTVVIHAANNGLELQATGEKTKTLAVDHKILELTVKNAVLVSITSTSVFLVTFCYSAFRFLLQPQTRLTLLMPMNMASIDALVNNICVIMLFPFGNKLYTLLCCCCDKCFKRICVIIAKKATAK